MMHRILELEKSLDLRLVTSDYKIISSLYLHGAMRSSDLFGVSGSSAANFQIILRRLKNEKVIVAQQLHEDGRARIYDITPEVRDIIDTIFSDVIMKPALRIAAGG